MGENKTMDQIHRGLLKKFHTLCGVLPVSYTHLTLPTNREV